MLHHHLPTLTHSEGEGALDVLRIAQLVHMLPENLSQVGCNLLVKGNLHQLQTHREAEKSEERTASRDEE